VLGCTLAMAGLFFGWQTTAAWLFGASVLMMAVSLAMSLREIWISGGALAILLGQLEHDGSSRGRSD
jgi:hypothetical protein